MAVTDVTRLLERNGFLAAGAEAAELVAAAAGDSDRLEGLVARRITGEPLAWITGTTHFCGLTIAVTTGVYVPRPQSEDLAEAAAARLPDSGVAIDLCTGAGALAAVLMAAHPNARVIATDVDPIAVACARSNGVEAFEGDLFEPLPRELCGQVDVVCGVVPYVPTPDLVHLQRDTFTFETPLSYDGGDDGRRFLDRAVRGASKWLKSGGALLLELGGDQGDDLASLLEECGFTDVDILIDDDGDARGVEATLA